MCEIGVLWRYRDSVMLKMLPPGIFEAFDDVYLMTYMFEAQITWAYFRLFGIEYEHRYVVGNSPTTYQLTEVPQAYYMPGLTKLINICRDPKFNLIGKGPSDLSVGWYNKEDNKPLVKKVTCIGIFAIHRTQQPTKCYGLASAKSKSRTSPSKRCHPFLRHMDTAPDS